MYKNLKYIISSIVCFICLIVEIVLITLNSEFVYIPILIALFIYGFIHFIFDLETIFYDNDKKE